MSRRSNSVNMNNSQGFVNLVPVQQGAIGTIPGLRVRQSLANPGTSVYLPVSASGQIVSGVHPVQQVVVNPPVQVTTPIGVHGGIYTGRRAVASATVPNVASTQVHFPVHQVVAPPGRVIINGILY